MLLNLFRMFIGKKMIMWALKLYTSTTKNVVDDNIVLLTEGAFDNDIDKVMAAAEALVTEYKKD